MAAALRILPLGLDSFWLDETSTARASRAAFGDMLVNRARAGHPPLYFALTWLIAHAPGFGAGTAEAMLRLPAALAGVACVPLVHSLARRLTARLGRRPAAGPAACLPGGAAGGGAFAHAPLLAALLLALHPLQVELSTLARGYTLVAALGLATTLLLVRALVRGQAVRTGTVLAYALLSLAAVHVHYSALLVVGAQVVWLVVRRRRRLAAGGAVALAGILPWYLWSGTVGYAAEQNLVWIPPFSRWTAVFAVTGQVADLDVRWMPAAALAAGGAVVLLALGLAAVGARAAWRGPVPGGGGSHRERPSAAGLVLALWLLPLAAGAAVSLAGGPNVLHKARYFATSSALLPVFVALGVAVLGTAVLGKAAHGDAAPGALRGSSRRRLATGGPVAVAALLVAAFAWMTAVEIDEPVGTDWKRMVAVLDAERAPGEELILLPDIPLRLLTLGYYHDDRYRLLGDLATLRGPGGAPVPGASPAWRAEKAPGVWLHVSPNAERALASRPEEHRRAVQRDLAALRRAFPRSREWETRGGGRLVHLTRRPAATLRGTEHRRPRRRSGVPSSAPVAPRRRPPLSRGRRCAGAGRWR